MNITDIQQAKALDKLSETESLGAFIVISFFCAIDAILASLCWWKFGGLVAAEVGGVYLVVLFLLTRFMAGRGR